MEYTIYHSVADKALEYLDRPYKWGADGLEQFDCSGFVLHLLRWANRWGTEDATADMIYKRFRNSKRLAPCRGYLVFWLRNGKAVHVAICLNKTHCVGAHGWHFGRVATAPLDYRKKLPENVVFIDPFPQ